MSEANLDSEGTPLLRSSESVTALSTPVNDPSMDETERNQPQPASPATSSSSEEQANNQQHSHLPTYPLLRHNTQMSELTEMTGKSPQTNRHKQILLYPQHIAVEFDKPLREDETEVPIKTERHDNTTKSKKLKTFAAKLCSYRKQLDPNAIQFALRMATGLTISALFVLIRTDDFVYPDAMWVLVSVLFVSWFPALDAASVIEKILQRLYGTFLGAILGLSCGFVSLLFQHHWMQCIFIGICMFVFNFGIIFTSAQCQVGGVKVIKKFAYATILAVLTFCIALMPFSLDKDPKWQLAVFRVMNVVVGCAVGALTAVAICPKSTMDVLYAKASKQVRMAGEASDAVLEVAAGVFANKVHINRLADELLQTRPMDMDKEWKFANSVRGSFSSDSSLSASVASTIRLTESLHTDTALRKYDETINDWRLSKMLFPMMKYDPFHKNWSHGPQAEALHTEIARTLARALRIQTTIVVMDGMIRSEAAYDFDQRQIDSFASTGRLIKTMLSLPLDRERSNPAARLLFDKLEETRKDLIRASNAVCAAAQDEWEDMERFESLKDFRSNLLSGAKEQFFDTARYSSKSDDLGRGLPDKATGREQNSLFFLQLLEHLILRSLRLYQAWKHAETIREELQSTYKTKD
ncbi:MAG: hypothetical protein SGILL_005112 [Bacillariaceae sp.]